MLGAAVSNPSSEVDVSTAPFDPDAYKRTTTDQWADRRRALAPLGPDARSLAGRDDRGDALSDDEREEASSEIEHELSRYETADGFEGPCELLLAAGTAPA
jgi:hypothetical protein